MEGEPEPDSIDNEYAVEVLHNHPVGRLTGLDDHGNPLKIRRQRAVSDFHAVAVELNGLIVLPNARISLSPALASSLFIREEPIHCFMTGTHQIEVRELKPSLVSDYLSFFDKAFSDFPDWAGCYCGFYDTPDREWDDSPNAGPEHRTAKSQRITSGNACGLLAYLGDKPVGWCNAQPRRSFVNMRSYKVAVTNPGESVGSIMCFIVDPKHRGKGISNILLNAACEMFQRAGLKIAEGYPTTNPRLRFGEIPWAEANYKGPLTMYLKNGFKIHRQLEKFAIVRKQL